MRARFLVTHFGVFHRARFIAQVCGRVQEASLLSTDGISQQRGSLLRLLQHLAAFIARCNTTGRTAAAPAAADVLARDTLPLPSRRLLFNGKRLTQLEGWVQREGAAISGAAPAAGNLIDVPSLPVGVAS